MVRRQTSLLVRISKSGLGACLFAYPTPSLALALAPVYFGSIDMAINYA